MKPTPTTASRNRGSIRFGIVACPIALVLILFAAEAAAARTLDWRSLDVTAELGPDGTLEVLERHEMVFTGNWNGGERRFRIGRGHRFRFQSIHRVDPATGERTELRRGGLDRVDHYEFVNGTTLRWRSRLPSDPAFDNTTLVYELRYTLSNILLEEGERYVLDHDFAFRDRPGTIQSFSVDLTLDPAWRVDPAFPAQFAARNLPPGQGYVVTVTLGRVPGAGAVEAATNPRFFRAALLIAALPFIAFWLRSYERAERAVGRYAPLVPEHEIDRDWLEKHVFRFRAEEVGAAWDQDIGPPEVMAIFARLVAEGKIESEVEIERFLWFEKSNLCMRLAVDRSQFEGYERTLVDAFFFDGRDEVDTKALRKHYRNKNFIPHRLVEDDLRERLNATPGLSRAGAPTVRHLWGLLALAFGAVVSFVQVEGPYDARQLLPLACAAGVTLIGMILALHVRKDLLRPRLNLWLLRVFAVMPVAMFSVVAGIERLANPFAVVAGALFCVGGARVMIDLAHTKSGPTLMAARRLLTAARWFFKRELARERPALEDAWFPYVVAVGLAPQVERWAKDYGRAMATGVAPHSSFQGSSSSSPSWTGGGSFGGAGASGAWAAAMTSFSAGGSTSSSGGGGGGSSGGGGGGGW